MEDKKPLALELFCGTKSFKKVFKKQFDVISLDINEKFNPDILSDILKWDYKNEEILKNKTVQFIWASPPCQEYSIANTGGNRDIVGANKIVKRVLEIIKYFKPKYWCIENP